MNDSASLRRFLAENPALRAAVTQAHRKLFGKIALIFALIALLCGLGIARYGLAALPVGIGAALLALIWQKPWKTFGRSRMGVIGKVEYQLRRVNSSKNFADPHYTAMTTANFIRCACRDGAGKRFAFTVDQRYEGSYRPKDTVIRLSGLPYPVNLSRKENRVCPICGQIDPGAPEAACVGCGRDSVRWEIPKEETEKEEQS